MVNTLIKYQLCDLSYINKEIKRIRKELKNTVKIFSDFYKTNESDLYKKAIIREPQSDIKLLRKIRKEQLKEKAKLNAKLLGKNTRYYSDDGSDGGINYWVFHKGCTNDDIILYLEKCGIDTEGVSIYSAYDCTGKYFSYEVDIYEKEKTIVASQRWGYDV